MKSKPVVDPRSAIDCLLGGRELQPSQHDPPTCQPKSGHTLAAAEAPERDYRSRVVKERLHQAAFRENVMTAYEHYSAVCRLRRVELVEVAHIVPDSLGGRPIVTNGMTMCKLHHAAFRPQRARALS